MTDRRTRLSAAAAAAVLVIQAWPTRHTTLDDAWITARYARFLAEGHGMVYNPGEWVEGASSPVWTAWLAIALRLGVEPGAAMVYGGLACGALLAPAVAWLVRRLGGSDAGAALAPWAVALSPHVAVACTNGLETAAWLVALVLACGGVAAEGRWRPVAGFFAGALPAVRPEGLPVAMALVAADAALSRGPGRLAYAAGALAPLALVHGWRLATYGALFPNPVAAKHTGALATRVAANLRLLAMDGPTWAVAAVLTAASPLLPGDRVRRVVPVGVAALLMGGFLRVEEWMPGARLALPLWVLGAAAWCAAQGPAALRIVPGVGALVVLVLSRGRVVAYDARNSVLPDNPASLAARAMAAAAPGATLAVRDAGVVAFHVGTEIRVVELHPRALTRPHPGGRDAPPPSELPDLLVTTVQREDAPASRYGADVAVFRTAEWRFLGRVEQHHHRYYDFWARPGLDVPELPSDLRIR